MRYKPWKFLLLSLSETPLPIAWESNCWIFRLKARDVIKTPAIKCVLRLRIVKVSDFNVHGSVWLSGQHSRFWPPQIVCEAGSGIAEGNNFSPLRSKRCSRSASVGDISSKFCSEAGVLAITTFCKVKILLEIVWWRFSRSIVKLGGIVCIELIGVKLVWVLVGVVFVPIRFPLKL